VIFLRFRRQGEQFNDRPATVEKGPFRFTLEWEPLLWRFSCWRVSGNIGDLHNVWRYTTVSELECCRGGVVLDAVIQAPDSVATEVLH